jgi:cytoplasmic iron level regulating protein YaaA (DUF328/UPF0246 family)
VLLLLPPSEAKVTGGDGPPLDAASDDATGLGAARREVLTAVAAFCRRVPRKAAAALKLPGGSAATHLADNIAALSLPTMPAVDRFSGVLFEALDVRSLTARQRARAGASVLVFSGAFGVLGGDEPVPVHRVPASATVPRVGGLTAYWRKRLDAVLAPRVDDAGLVVDLRSTDYAAMWQPTAGQRAAVVPVRVLEQRRAADGSVVRRPVSWSSKHGKGLLARELVRSHTGGRPLRGVGQVADAGRRLGYTVVETAAGTGRGLDLVAVP